MTRFLISFPGVAMSHIPAEDFSAVGDAAHAVVREAKAAGVYVFSGGLDEEVDPVLVAGDGAVVSGAFPQTAELTGGMTVIDVPSRDEALEWAAKLAAACRCAQEVRAFMFDPEA